MAKSKKSTKAKTKTRAVDTAPTPVAQATDAAPVPKATPSSKAGNLRTWNIWLAVLHGVQGLAILVLAATHSWPVTTSYLSKDPIASQIAGHSVMATAVKHLFDVNLAVLVATFFFVAALTHLLIATKCRAQYESDLARRFNRARWIEYGVSGGVMLVVMGLLSGMSDLSSLVMLFALSLIAGVVGLSVELHTGKTRTVLFWLSCLVGLVPWAVFAIYIYGAHVGGGHIPGFLYAVYATMFVLSALLAYVLHKAGSQQGRWGNYLYSERAFIVLSFVIKAALAWQVFAGALRP
jgi:hypothetical protein